MTNTSYVAYSDKVEEQRPDEDELIDSTVKALRRSNELANKRYKHGVRDQHAKIHGVLRGELTVYPDLPDTFARVCSRRRRPTPSLPGSPVLAGRSGATKYTVCGAWRSRCSACRDRRWTQRTTG